MVAALSERGCVAVPTVRNTRGIDVLASNEDASRQAAIQVKANRTKRRVWPLNEKAETYYADNLFYVFVILKGQQERPDFFIVPSVIVARKIREGHQEWLRTPGRGGRPHRDNTIRTWRDSDGEYLERWELLNL